MGWVPDHIWYASKGKDKGKGKGKSSGKGSNWIPDELFYALKAVQGKGKGSGSSGPWQSQWKKKAVVQNAVPDSFNVNSKLKYSGTCTQFSKFKGFGFIELDKKGLIPTDSVFVYWDAIVSADRFPQLKKDLKVQFNLEKTEKNGKQTVVATNVTLPGGKPVEVQDEVDGKRQYVGGQFLRYSGTLKFFKDKQGFGYVDIDDGFDYGGEKVPKSIRVETPEINSGGKAPSFVKDIQVEFGIMKTKAGDYKAYNMTQPGGEPLPSK